MSQQNQRFFNVISLLMDAAIAFFSMLIAYWIRFYILPGAEVSYSFSYFLWMAVISAVLHVFIYGAVRMYTPLRSLRAYTVLSRILAGETICLLVILAGLYVLELINISRMVVFISFMLGTFFSACKYMGTRLILRSLREKGFNQKTQVILGSGETARKYRALLSAHPEYGYNVCGYLSGADDWEGQQWLGAYDRLEAVLNELSPNEAIIALPASEYPEIFDVIAACEKTGTIMRIIPCYDEYISAKMNIDTVDGINIENIRDIPLAHTGSAMIKRTVDILASLFAIALFSPIMLVAAIGTRISSPGPVLFRQERIGKDKKPFYMLKFRSMRVNDREETGWSGPTDNRRTRFGAFLRKFSIDELPQFFNVLKGDMSIVGPRPELPHYVKQFREEIPLYMIKHYVKPGITGWAQVNGYRGDTSIAARIEYDLYYIENWTLPLDIRIMFMTVFKMVNDEKV